MEDKLKEQEKAAKASQQSLPPPVNPGTEVSSSNAMETEDTPLDGNLPEDDPEAAADHKEAQETCTALAKELAIPTPALFGIVSQAYCQNLATTGHRPSHTDGKTFVRR